MGLRFNDLEVGSKDGFNHLHVDGLRPRFIAFFQDLREIVGDLERSDQTLGEIPALMEPEVSSKELRLAAFLALHVKSPFAQGDRSQVASSCLPKISSWILHAEQEPRRRSDDFAFRSPLKLEGFWLIEDRNLPEEQGTWEYETNTRTEQGEKQPEVFNVSENGNRKEDLLEESW